MEQRSLRNIQARNPWHKCEDFISTTTLHFCFRCSIHGLLALSFCDRALLWFPCLWRASRYIFLHILLCYGKRLETWFLWTLLVVICIPHMITWVTFRGRPLLLFKASNSVSSLPLFAPSLDSVFQQKVLTSGCTSLRNFLPPLISWHHILVSEPGINHHPLSFCVCSL